MSTLLLRLAGPLQAWGTESKFNTRQTGIAPSKSGVIGMLAAALGLRRDADLSALNALRFGVRTDRRGELLMDFQMVHYIGNADTTYRYYLSDAVFLVGLEGERAFLETLKDALCSPVWPLYLGRRSCPPEQPLLIGIKDLPLEEALRREPWQVSERVKKQWSRSHPGEPVKLQLITDADGTGVGRAAVRDLPVSFDQRNRRYAFRMAEMKAPAEVYAGEDDAFQPTEHDAFAELEDL